MALAPTPAPSRLGRATQALTGCLAFAHPISPACLRPVVGQSENVACAVSRCRARAGARVAARHPRRLLRMKAHTDAGTPLREHRHDPSDVRVPLAAAATVIGQTGQKASPLQTGRDLVLAPRIQDMRQAHSGQAWGEDSAWPDAGCWVLEPPSSLPPARSPCPIRRMLLPSLPRWRRTSRRRVLSLLAQYPHTVASPIRPMPAVMPRGRPSRKASCGLRAGRTLYALSQQSCSYSAASSMATARWTMLSATAGLPIGRCPPSACSLQTRTPGAAWARPLRRRA